MSLKIHVLPDKNTHTHIPIKMCIHALTHTRLLIMTKIVKRHFCIIHGREAAVSHPLTLQVFVLSISSQSL